MSSNTEMQKTLKMLKKLPMYKELKRENKELVERIRSLEYAVQYLESKLKKKQSKQPHSLKPIKLEPEPTKKNVGLIDLTEDDDDDNQDHVVLVIEEVHEEVHEVDEALKQNTLDELLAKYPDYQTHKEIKEVVEDIVEEIVVSNEEEEEEVVLEEEEEVVEEEVVEEEVVEEEVVEEEVVEEEVVEEEEEEEEVVEEEEEEVVEEEEVEVEVEEQEEEDVYEIQINGKTYYVTNEIDSTIYEADEEGEITIEAGAYKNGKPVFN